MSGPAHNRTDRGGVRGSKGIQIGVKWGHEELKAICHFHYIPCSFFVIVAVVVVFFIHYLIIYYLLACSFY